MLAQDGQVAGCLLAGACEKVMLPVATVFVFDEWHVLGVLLQQVLGGGKAFVWVYARLLGKCDGSVYEVVCFLVADLLQSAVCVFHVVQQLLVILVGDAEVIKRVLYSQAERVCQVHAQRVGAARMPARHGDVCQPAFFPVGVHVAGLYRQQAAFFADVLVW